MVVMLQVEFFWFGTPCSVVEGYQSLETAWTCVTLVTYHNTL